MVAPLLVPLLLVAGSPLMNGSRAAVATTPATVPIDELASRAAVAMRRHDCAAAIATLAPAAVAGPNVKIANLLVGFYAHSCESVADAEEHLFAASDPGGPFEDWRLFLLSNSAHAQGHVLLARAALAKLVGDYPSSPLRARALLRAATYTWEQGDKARSVALIEQARHEGLKGDESTGLEALAWDIGGRTADAAVRLEAARHLLSEAPGRAASLNVADTLRAPKGDLSWSSVLSPDQLKLRARSLLALDLGPSALAALESIESAGQDLQWHLLKADVLARLHRGADAVALLNPLHGSTPQEETELEWARAMAAADLASAQRGRSNPSTAERLRMREEMRKHLERVAVSPVDPTLAAKALHLLFIELTEEGQFEASIQVLRRLRALEPRDTTGAASLWTRGWQEFSRGNYTGAIGYWTELTALYPDDSTARRGHYWTARSFDALGEHARAHDAYLELANADTDDFYRHNAVARLGHLQRTPAAVNAATRSEPWPTDSVLARARLLSDWGLDGLAQEEMTLVGAKAQPLAARALGALILARKGQLKDSVLAIRAAFPALGGAYQASVPPEALRLYYPLEYQAPVRTWATARHISPYLVYGIIRQESAFDANALSVAGARGLMQLMPSTARELAHGLGLPFQNGSMADPAFNLQVGTEYLRQVLQMFDDNLELALAGYNCGPFRIKRLWHQSGSHDVDRFLEGLTIEESKVYVKRILVLSDSYRQLYPDAG
jgi:soluble lytic murein transglycosylase-like protein